MSLSMIGGDVPRLSSSTSPSDWRSSFDSFCRSSYIDESKLYSETVCKEVGDKIMHLLKGKPSSLWERDPFCVWVKTKGFALTSYPMLGLKEVLCVPVHDPLAGSASWRRVAYIEEFHDIISKFHIVNGDHLSATKTHTEVSKHYAGVPQLAIEKYLQLCPSCHGSTSSPVETPVLKEPKREKSGYFMKKGQVEVIDITDKPLGPFCYICLYIDTYSNYHILFPLSSPSSSSPSSEVPFEEIAHNLRKYVFPYFGMPKSLSSSLGSDFIDDLLRETCLHWPDAVVVRNGCKKSERGGERVGKLAKRSKSLISELFERCRSNLQDISLTPSACSDLLLSLQYQLNISTRKSSQKCAYELAFNVRPHCSSQSPRLHPSDTPISSNSSEDEIEGNVRKWQWDPERLIMKSKKENDIDMIGSDRNSISNDITPSVEMNRLIQKPSSSSSTNSQQKLHQMLNASSIQAQEQQVTSLRELLRQEESRLELLKKMRQPNETPSIISKDLSSHERGVVSTGVIRSGDALITHNGSQGPISARLQQLVDSVAVDQLNSKYSSSTQHNKKKSTITDINKSSSPEVITISDSPSPASPPALISTSTVPGVIHNPSSLSSGEKPDESLVMKTIENSRRYREFLVKQNTVKRTFQKQIDKRISSFPYPKTFRQVWPIIPVQDPSFVKNLGLETVTQFFDQPHTLKGSGSSGGTGASKVKPICNQCGCDFASAWQIRKNNSKQVLLCEACDFTNLKLLQRTKLTSQLKEIIEGVKREEDKFNSETEEARKQLIATERVGVISNTQKSSPQPTSHTSHLSPHGNHIISTSGGGIRHQSLTERVADAMIPSIIGGKGGRPGVGATGGGRGGGKSLSQTEKTKSPLEISRKRKIDQQEMSHSVPSSKTPKTHLDVTLNRITQQLLMKQVDEKVHKRRRKDISSPSKNRQGKSPPPLEVANHTPHEGKSAPPPLMSATPSSVGGDSRRNRRKGQPKQNIKT